MEFRACAASQVNCDDCQAVGQWVALSRDNAKQAILPYIQRQLHALKPPHGKVPMVGKGSELQETAAPTRAQNNRPTH